MTPSTMFTFFLICSNASNCPTEPIYHDDVFYSLDSCKEDAIDIARAMHYKQGGDWAYKCIVVDYQPKELP